MAAVESGGLSCFLLEIRGDSAKTQEGSER